MKTNRVLILSTYPIKRPQHGGQKRTDAIYRAYTDAFRYVRHSAVFFRGFYAVFDHDDIPLGLEGERQVLQSPLTGDIVCGEAIYNDPTVKKKMTRLLETFQPDIIHVEQPFPYLGLKPLLNELGMNPIIVFGSQNIEAPMKREILEGAGVEQVVIEKVTKQISELETELSRDSALVVACTKSDIDMHEQMGAKATVLAPNGMNQISTSPPLESFWRKKFEAIGVDKTALFVGSAHPPNWSGFLQMIGKGIGFMPFDSRLVLAGSICDYFEREIQANALDLQDATFWLRAYSAGRLEEDSLSALIRNSEVILLPITEGGGSNLKTAEAILADKKVVATNHALRSFEWFKQFPNLWVADEQEEFQQCIREALSATYRPRSSDQQRIASQVEWSHCLFDMIQKVKDIC